MNMETFLMAEAKELIEKTSKYIPAIVSYQEDVNDDAINGDAWLDNRTSFIWKVGVLSVADGNKRDWASLFIAHQRSPSDEVELIGKLDWLDGENDDIARCLRRYLKCASRADVLYEYDKEYYGEIDID